MAMSAIETLTAILAARGRPIRAVRVSRAKARGKAARYAYWGCARYVVRLGCKGWPISVAVQAADSDRRSLRLAEEDAEVLAEREGRIRCQAIGRLSESEAAVVVAQAGGLL